MSETEEKVIKMCAEKDNGSKAIKKVVNNVENYIEKRGGNAIQLNTEKTVTKMRAAFLKSKIWPANTTINVAFVKSGFHYDKIPRTETVVLKKKVDRNGVQLKLDPLQEEVDDMSVRDAIIYTIMKRFNDVVYPEYKPASVTIDPSYVPMPLINLKFNFFDPTDPSRKKLFNPNLADIKIDFDPKGGAWSLLGTDSLSEKKDVATMNFGWFDVPTTLHEFCHALGMVHEHSNPNGKPINWAVCHVTKWANSTQGWDADTIKENIIEKYKVDQINGSEFDPQSIMLYFFPGTIVCKEDANTKAPDITVGDVKSCFTGCAIVNKELTACNIELDKCERPGQGTAQNLRFSPWDVLYLNNIYPPETQSLSNEQVTVKFFNDNYGEQITSEELSRQLKMTKERENPAEEYEHEEQEKFENEMINEMFEEINKEKYEKEKYENEKYENEIREKYYGFDFIINKNIILFFVIATLCFMIFGKLSLADAMINALKILFFIILLYIIFWFIILIVGFFVFFQTSGTTYGTTSGTTTKTPEPILDDIKTYLTLKNNGNGTNYTLTGTYHGKPITLVDKNFTYYSNLQYVYKVNEVSEFTFTNPISNHDNTVHLKITKVNLNFNSSNLDYTFNAILLSPPTEMIGVF